MMLRPTWLSSLAAVMLLVSACGFEPMYGTQGGTAARSSILAAVQVETPKGRLGELLRAEIEDGINPEYRYATPLYRLNIALTEQDTALFINPDGTSSRGDLRYTSSYTLTRIDTKKIIHEGSVTRVSSYNSSETADYAAFVSREDARVRALTELAQDYKLRLANLSAKLTP
jgi:LPS-assembly lipoprotein